jgi:hypothetical protein
MALFAAGPRSIFYAYHDKMLALLTLGFLAFGVGLIIFTFYTEWLRRPIGEPFLNVPSELFVAKIPPIGADEVTRLSPDGAMTVSSEKLLANAGLSPMTLEVAEDNWGAMTSETCYRADIGESLKKTRNFLQRTNNYQHAHPDSCSAPYHEFVGTFYTPFDGVGRTPASGLPYPSSTAACWKAAV